MIVLVNRSTLVTDAEVALIALACHAQLRDHVSPAWGKRTTPVHCLHTAPIAAYQVVVLDNADQAGTLGYHDETPQGQPYARVFAGPVLDNGGDVLVGALSVAVTASHEVIEMFCDPNINDWADNGRNAEIAIEACDAVEDRAYQITVPPNMGVSVSDFVLPAYFDVQSKHGPYDHLHALSTPWSLTTGGYTLIRTAGQVHQTFGENYPPWRLTTKKSPAARTARRTQG